ncbi:hypothetical protein [Streptomyces fodineus]|uniref:hypothetical protein n=1 Tax=Streptomyces fodineus TaxID=1904616 RepID=UPI000B26D8A4|nr:hypothetical protein [Streptomyces fodineus]
MSEYMATPSQAEGEREPDEAGADMPPRTIPSQAEGENTSEQQDVGEGDDCGRRHEHGTHRRPGGAGRAEGRVVPGRQGDPDSDLDRTAAQRAERAREGGRPGLSQHLREEPRTPIQEEFGR